MVVIWLKSSVESTLATKPARLQAGLQRILPEGKQTILLLPPNAAVICYKAARAGITAPLASCCRLHRSFRGYCRFCPPYTAAAVCRHRPSLVLLMIILPLPPTLLSSVKKSPKPVPRHRWRLPVGSTAADMEVAADVCCHCSYHYPPLLLAGTIAAVIH